MNGDFIEEQGRLLDAADCNDPDQALRPASLKEYIGQHELKHNLNVYIQAARSRSEVLDHVLLFGPPGLGKTTLANIIALEMHGNLVTASGPAIGKSGDLAAILSTLEPGDVLFIDEIHRIPRPVEEILYSAMEDFFLDIVVGKEGNSAHTIRLTLPPFTLVGATTRAGDLSAPLRDRFGIVLPLEYYSQSELEQIVRRSAKIFEVEMDDQAVSEVALRSRGTPRIANRMLKRIRDFAQVYNGGWISREVADDSLSRLRVDKLGLDATDRKFLEGIILRFGGGPVGLEALASSIGEDAATLEDMYEPYLLQIGLINRTPRGRVATPKAYRHLKIALSGEDNEN